MKKYLNFLVALLLCIGIISPISASAASKTYYYTVEGTSNIKPGIYKGAVNGKGKAIYTEKVYKLKKLSKPPVKIEGSYVFYGKGSAAKSSDYKNTSNLITLPIQYVQASGNNLYFTKQLFKATYNSGTCGGGGADILEIYKQDSKGKVSKVVTDKVTSNTTQPFFVKNKYIYYAKLNKNPLGNYTIVRSTLDGKKKITLKKSVDNFWASGKYIYYVSKNTLYRMDMNGKNSKKYSNLKVQLYGHGGCDAANYTVTSNGIAADSAGKVIYLDFSTGKTTNIKGILALEILDVDVKKNRVIALEVSGKKYTISSFNFNGKRLKKSNVTVDSVEKIYSADAKNGEVFYIKGTNLKKITF